MIGVDWGTTSLRAYRIGADGGVTDRVERARGILTVEAGGFPGALDEAVGEWIAAGERRVLLCGMVGSRQGWMEAPYLPCPAGSAEIAAATVAVPFEGAEVRLVPGLTAEDSESVDAPHSPEAFARGVARAGQSGGLLHHLFGARTLHLMDRLAQVETRSFLSGLLIGHEIRAAAEGVTRVELVGAAGLTASYAEALRLSGIEVRTHDPDLVAAGLHHIARSLSWV